MDNSLLVGELDETSSSNTADLHGSLSSSWRGFTKKGMMIPLDMKETYTQVFSQTETSSRSEDKVAKIWMMEAINAESQFHSR